MPDPLTTRYQRWQEAEAAARDEESDAALLALVQALPDRARVTPAFATKTMEAVAAAAARDAQRARRIRRIVMPSLAAAAVVALYLGAGLIGSALSRVLIVSLDVLIGTVVAAATAMQRDGGGWGMLSSLGRAAGAVLSNPAVTATVFVLQGCALAALMVLRRLLGTDGESLR